jgi:hypothetical protein
VSNLFSWLLGTKSIPLEQSLKRLRILVFTLNDDFNNFIYRTKYDLKKDGTSIPELPNNMMLCSLIVLIVLTHHPLTPRQEKFRLVIIRTIEYVIIETLKKSNKSDSQINSILEVTFQEIWIAIRDTLRLYQLGQPSPFYPIFIYACPISDALSNEEIHSRFDGICAEMYKTANTEISKLLL